MPERGEVNLAALPWRRQFAGASAASITRFAKEGQQLLNHPLGTLLGNPMATSLRDAAGHIVGDTPPGINCAHPAAAPMWSAVAEHGHLELAILLQEFLVISYVMGYCAVEIEARPHRSWQSIGTYVLLLRFERDGVGARTPLAIEET